MGFFDTPLNTALFLLVIVGVPWYLALQPAVVLVNAQSKYLAEYNPNDAAQITALQAKHGEVRQVQVSRLDAIKTGFFAWISENSIGFLVLVGLAGAAWWFFNRKVTAFKQIRTLSEARRIHAEYTKHDMNARLRESELHHFYQESREMGFNFGNDKGVWLVLFDRVVSGLPISYYPRRLLGVWSSLKEAGVAGGTPFRGYFSEDYVFRWLGMANVADLVEAPSGFQTDAGVLERLSFLEKKGYLTEELVTNLFKAAPTQTGPVMGVVK